MKNAKHTPGPWYSCLNASEPDQRRYIRSDKSALSPCKLIEYVGQPIGEFEANARLIAASPENFQFIKGVEARVRDVERALASNNLSLALSLLTNLDADAFDLINKIESAD